MGPWPASSTAVAFPGQAILLAGAAWRMNHLTLACDVVGRSARLCRWIVTGGRDGLPGGGAEDDSDAGYLQQ